MTKLRGLRVLALACVLIGGALALLAAGILPAFIAAWIVATTVVWMIFAALREQ